MSVTQIKSSNIETSSVTAAKLHSTAISDKLGFTPASNAITLTINGTGYDLTANRTWSVGTVTSVSGTAPIASSGGNTPAISISQSNTTTDGYLSGTDWTTFNNKQAALVSSTNIKTVSGTSLLGSGDLGTIGVGYGGTGTSTAFTAGSVVFAGASGVYSQDNANFFWDDTNNRLGIGTSSPSAPLTVASSTTLSAASPSILLQGSSNTERIHIRSSISGGGQAVTLLAGSNGTPTSPTAITNQQPLGYYQLGGYDGTAWSRASWITGFAEENWSGTNRGSSLIFATTPIGSTTITERMRIDSSGNVGIGTSSPTSTLTVAGTGITNANWTTATRPSAPSAGQQGYNTTLNLMEVYTGTAWVAIGDQASLYSVEYLVVAGGGGGGKQFGGGGGAGGYISTSTNVNSGTAYSIVIGAGGAGKSVNGTGSNGDTSSGFGTSTTGGGGGGGGSPVNGASGGSGGGGSGKTGGGVGGSGGAGTSGQGNAGGTGTSSTLTDGGGGGGGAGAVGQNAANANPTGSGGAGLNWQSLGTFYAGGGGGSTNASGGSGGGGNGSASSSGANGTANTGGGGGATNTGTTSGAGGSGVVIVRYFGSQKGTGGTVTSSGGYTYHTFTTSGTYTA
jgi:hypothetical protein